MKKILTLTILASTLVSAGAMASPAEPTIDQVISRQIDGANALCKSVDGLSSITTMSGRTGFMASCEMSQHGRYEVEVSYDNAKQTYKWEAKFDERWAPAFSASIDSLRAFEATVPDLKMRSSSTSASIVMKFPA